VKDDQSDSENTLRMKREHGKHIRSFELNGHDATHKAELRQHDKDLVVWYVDRDIRGKDEREWKIFLAGPEAERYRK